MCGVLWCGVVWCDDDRVRLCCVPRPVCLSEGRWQTWAQHLCLEHLLLSPLSSPLQPGRRKVSVEEWSAVWWRGVRSGGVAAFLSLM